MLYSQKPSKTSYPSLQSLKVEPIEPIRPQNIRQSAKISYNITTKLYLRSELFSRLKDRFTFESSHEFDLIAEILSKQFEFKINTIYSSVSNLPLPVFACGYCKETFHTGVEYILHCFDFKCPINHQRSTFFVCFKDNLALINNQDVQKILIQHNINTEQHIFFSKRQLNFATYELKRKDETINDIKTKFRCGRCQRTQFYSDSNIYFEKHCFGICKSYNLEQNSHQLVIFENNQLQEEFVQDIKNFWLNINILNLFKNSYIQMKNNQKLTIKNQKVNGQLCSNCGLSFQEKEQFLRHALFDCHSKPNNSSTQLITIKSCPLKIKPDSSYKQKCRLITRQFVKRQLQGKKKWDQVTAKINKRYEKIWQRYEEIYFCASCYYLYSDFGLYLAHFNLTCCVVNHQLNSHTLSDRFDQPLTQETIQLYEEKQDIDFFLRIVPASMSRPKMFHLTELIHKQTGSFFSTTIPARCGKCGLYKKMFQNNYLVHLINKCKDPYHPKNTYRIVYKQKPIILSEIIWFLEMAHYCLQIAKIIKHKKVRLQKNEAFPNQSSLGINQQTYCGKCKRWMESPYECYYHYLTECDGINSPNSSHFFHLSPILNNSISSNLFDIVKFDGYWRDDRIKINLAIPIEKDKRTNKVDKIDSRQSQFENEPQQKPKKIIKQKQDSKQQQQNPYSNQHIESQVMNKKQTKQSKSHENESKDYENDQYLDIYPNIDYLQSQEKNFYCGKCRLAFKKRQSFIDHIFVCGNFSHPDSSHFILNQTKFNDVNWDHLMNLKDFQQTNPKSYPTYTEDPKKVICGCGDTNISGLSHHMNNYHSGVIPKGTSHFFLRYKIPKVKTPVCIFLPIEPKPDNEKDMFVCPCNPQKKLPYREFANHILKRHNGKSPTFYMKKSLEQSALEKKI